MCLNPIKIRNKKTGIGQEVSCGKCLECLQRYSVEWSFRIMNEALQFKDNCFITLTYNDEHLPEGGNLCPRDLQLFLKRLREALSPLRIRFFACGEYGKKLKRPHYHLIVFNWKPIDGWLFDRREHLYRSPFLEKLWTAGFSSFGELTIDSAKYCAKYMNKWQYDRSDKELVRPFLRMSNRPGIGYNKALKSDLVGDRIYVNGRSCKIPRYYLKVLEREGVYLDDFKERRQFQGQMIAERTVLSEKRKKFRDKFLSDNLPYP